MRFRESRTGWSPRDPGKSENAWFLRGTHPGGWAPFEFLKMHLYQYTQKIEHCSNKFDFLPLFCLEGLVPNSVLSGSRGKQKRKKRQNPLDSRLLVFITVLPWHILKQRPNLHRQPSGGGNASVSASAAWQRPDLHRQLPQP